MSTMLGIRVLVTTGLHEALVLLTCDHHKSSIFVAAGDLKSYLARVIMPGLLTVT